MKYDPDPFLRTADAQLSAHQTARGWHFVKVEETIEPRVMRFVEVREQVVRDWFDDKRSKSINDRIAVLKEKYDVEIER